MTNNEKLQRVSIVKPKDIFDNKVNISYNMYTCLLNIGKNLWFLHVYKETDLHLSLIKS